LAYNGYGWSAGVKGDENGYNGGAVVVTTLFDSFRLLHRRQTVAIARVAATTTPTTLARTIPPLKFSLVMVRYASADLRRITRFKQYDHTDIW